MFASCSVLQAEPTEWEPLDIALLVAQSADAEPAAWLAVPEPEFGETRWPSLVPAPMFLATGVGGSVGDGAVIGADGSLTNQERSSTKPDESDVVAYMALLRKEGFVVDQYAASDGWFVRDGFEWIFFANSPTREYWLAGDYSLPDSLAAGFDVNYTTDTSRFPSYCVSRRLDGQIDRNPRCVRG